MYLNEKERIPIFHSLSRIFFFPRQNIDITRASLHRQFCLNPFFTSRGALITINAPDIRPQKSEKWFLQNLFNPVDKALSKLDHRFKRIVKSKSWVCWVFFLTMQCQQESLERPRAH